MICGLCMMKALRDSMSRQKQIKHSDKQNTIFCMHT